MGSRNSDNFPFRKAPRIRLCPESKIRQFPNLRRLDPDGMPGVKRVPILDRCAELLEVTSTFALLVSPPVVFRT